MTSRFTDVCDHVTSRFNAFFFRFRGRAHLPPWYNKRRLRQQQGLFSRGGLRSPGLSSIEVDTDTETIVPDSPPVRRHQVAKNVRVKRRNVTAETTTDDGTNSINSSSSAVSPTGSVIAAVRSAYHRSLPSGEHPLDPLIRDYPLGRFVDGHYRA